MDCPTCGSQQLQRNGYRNGIQCYKCKRCGRQFLESYKQVRYSEKVKQLCIQMYLQGRSARDIEKSMNIHHTTILSWVRRIDSDVLELLDTDNLDSVEKHGSDVFSINIPVDQIEEKGEYS